MAVEIHRSFLSGGYESRFTIGGTLGVGELSLLVDSSLRGLIPGSVWEGALPLNMKGRDVPPVSHGKGDLLFAVEGATPAEGDPGDADLHRFKVACITRFLEFKGGSTVRYTPEIVVTGPLPNTFSYRNLGRAIPLELSAFSVGFELFRPRCASSLLGTAPVVEDRVYLRADVESWSLLFWSEGLSSREAFPLRDSALLGHFQETFDPWLKGKLQELYREDLANVRK